MEDRCLAAGRCGAAPASVWCFSASRESSAYAALGDEAADEAQSAVVEACVCRRGGRLESASPGRAVESEAAEKEKDGRS